MKEESRIAVIVVTYNRERMLKRCMEALFQQTVPLCKICVIDNASTDETEKMMQVFQRAVCIIYRNIRMKKITNFQITLFFQTMDSHLIMVFMQIICNADWHDFRTALNEAEDRNQNTLCFFIFHLCIFRSFCLWFFPYFQFFFPEE